MSLTQKGFEIFQEHGFKELLQRSFEEIERPIITRQLSSNKIVQDTYDIPKLIELSPDDIKYVSVFSSREIPINDRAVERSSIHNENIVGVYGGRWDKLRRKWKNYDIYTSFVSQFEQGKSWEETERFKRKKAEIKEDHKYDIKVRDLKQSGEMRRNIYNSMKEHGYIPQSKIKNNPEKYGVSDTNVSDIVINGKKYPDECRIGIGRHGEIIRFKGGKHRISAAKILGINNMTALLTIRHKNWQKFRKEVDKNGLPNKHKELRDHPDLQDVI